MKRKSIVTRRYDITPAFKAKALRNTRTRLRLVDGKFQHRCFLVNHPDLPGDPPPVGAALPEPAPKPKPTPAAESWFHTISADVDDAGEMHLTIDGQPEPYHGPERPQVWTRCAGDGAAICAQCKRTFFQADGEDCLCHNCWAASIDLGGITPPWPGGAA